VNANPKPMKTFGFVLCHGWALTPHSLIPIAEALLRAFPECAIKHIDLGYYGEPHQPTLADSTLWIGIGHSQGFAHLAAMPTSWAGLVSLNGFRWFCKESSPENQAQSGTPKRVLERMLKRIDTHPEAVISEFLARCGYLRDDLPPTQNSVMPTPNIDTLKQGLQHLIELSLPNLPHAPLLAIASPDDAIVSPELSSASFERHTTWLPPNAPHCAMCKPEKPAFEAITSPLISWINTLHETHAQAGK